MILGFPRISYFFAGFPRIWIWLDFDLISIRFPFDLISVGFDLISA